MQISNSRNFAKIAKISLGLRKFRSHSENFAILAKLCISAIPKIFAKALFLEKFCIFATHKNFAKLAKLPLPSENS